MVTAKNDLNFIKQEKVFEEKTKKNFVSTYNKYLDKLIFFNTKFVKDMDIAKDIASDSFIKSLQKIDTYDPEKSAFSTWLFTISRNECIQYLNKSKKITSMDRVVDQEGTTIKDFIEDDTDDNIKEKEFDNLNIKKGSILKSKIDDLKSPYKNVIKLREVEKKSYREITIILRESENVFIKSNFFDSNYKDGILSLVDPEIKKDREVAKMFKINNIVDEHGTEIPYHIISTDKDGLISEIKLPIGNYYIDAEIPFNMSTLKSQIRNGRIMLQRMVKSEFESLDKLYL